MVTPSGSSPGLQMSNRSSMIALDLPSKIISLSSVCVQLKPRNAIIILAEEMCRGELPHGKEAPNHQKPWTPEDKKRRERLAEGNGPTRVIALKLACTEEAVRSRKRAISTLPSRSQTNLPSAGENLSPAVAYAKTIIRGRSLNRRRGLAMRKKVIAPAAIVALKQALTDIY